MNQASVGWHCPNCVSAASKQARPAQRVVQRAMQGHQPIATMTIMALNALVFLWDAVQGSNVMSGGGSEAARDFGLFAPYVEQRGEWYRVVTSAFTHSGIIHIGFNMYLLWVLGQSIEGRFGPKVFVPMYATGIVGGAVGAMLLEPTSSVVGASGAVFGLMGVMVVLQQMGGVNIFKSGIGGLVLINVMLSFRSGISLGGHLGGLVVGLAMGALLGEARRRGAKFEALVPFAILVLGALVTIALFPVLDRALTAF